MGLERIYRPGYRYAKAGVNLIGLTPAANRQTSLLPDAPATSKSIALMRTMDAINREMGQDTAYLASAGIQKRWAHAPDDEVAALYDEMGGIGDSGRLIDSACGWTPRRRAKGQT